MELYASERMSLHEYVISQIKRNISPLVIVKNIRTERFKTDEDIIGRDIFLTITYHRALWQWLSENPKKVKSDFIEEFHITGYVVNNCFLCSYADHATYVDNEDEFETSSFSCAICPVKWPSSLTENQCMYSDEEHFLQNERDGLFLQFCRNRHDDSIGCSSIDSHLEFLSLAKRIRDLPLTDEVAAIFKSEGLK